MAALRQGAAIVVTAMVGVMITVSLGALLFTGDLAAHASAGVSIALFSSAVVGAVIAWRGSMPETVAGMQDSPTILLSLAVAAMAASAPATATPDRLYASALALISVGTVTTGAAALLLGRLRLGALIRFMPYPVVGGFLAGTGWLLIAGSVQMLTGTTLTVGTLPELFTGATAVRWAPSMVLGGMLLWMMARWRNTLLLPLSIPALIVAFYVVASVVGVSPRAALDGGWLLGPFPEAAGWRPDPIWTLQHADWALVVGQAGTVASLLVIVLVSVVLTATGLELALDTDVDVDQELSAAGLGSLLAGLAGGAVGYTWLSPTVLGRTVGGRGRSLPLGVAGLSALALLVGSRPLMWFPRPVLGVVLTLLGLSFLQEWLGRAWQRMAPLEYAIVVAILLVIATLGFLPGVGLGIVMAIVMFAVAASRVDTVKHELSGTDNASHVDRSDAEQAVLASARAHVHVVVLHGFLFFGTAHAVTGRVRRRIEEPSEPALKYAVIDFRLVTGVDSSAVFFFAKLRRALARAGTVLVLSQLPPAARRAMEGAGVLGAADVVTAQDLDHALEWCEDRLLEQAGLQRPLTDLRTALSDLLADSVDPGDLLSRFQHIELQPRQRLISQGDAPAGLYVITKGEVSVERAGDGEAPMRLRRLRAGAVVGEMGLYLEAPASAAVVAVTTVTAALLPTAAFRELEAERPALAAAIHRALVRTLARRLSESHRAIEALRG